MHQALMDVPNMLFYQNRIKCGYQTNLEKQFMYSQNPFLFIDVSGGYEQIKGTSYYNLAEVKAIKQYVDYCNQVFK